MHWSGSMESSPVFSATTELSLTCRVILKWANENNVLDDARRKLALWRYDDNNVRPHSSLGKKYPQKCAGRLSNLRTPRPARLPKPKPKNMKTGTADAHYERGNLGGQISLTGSSMSLIRMRQQKNEKGGNAPCSGHGKARLSRAPMGRTSDTDMV